MYQPKAIKIKSAGFEPPVLPHCKTNLATAAACNQKYILSSIFSAKHCYKGDCYFIHETPMKDSAGEMFCRESGYQAVKVSSHDENDYLLKLVRESTSDDSVPLVLLGK